MLPDPLDSALPAIVRGAAILPAFRASEPRTLPVFVWPPFEVRLSDLPIKPTPTTGVNTNFHHPRSGVRA